MSKKIILQLLTCLLLTSCMRQILTVQTEYLSHENLASYHVRTPDPLLWNPPIGQRLLVSWHLPPSIKPTQNLALHIQLHFHNHTEKIEMVQIGRSAGTYVYSVLNEDYTETRGILTYKVQLTSDDEIVEEWRHHLWVDLITLGQENHVK